MRVFVTGGSGYVGTAVVRALAEAGHAVVGLVRSDDGAARLAAAGGEAVRGGLARPEEWTDAAAAADAVVHLAQDYDADDRREADLRVVSALVEAARRGGARSLVYLSNAFLLGDQGAGILHEDDPWPRPPQWGAWRLDVEAAALAAGGGGLAAAVVRPGQVYGGAGGTLPLLFRAAVDEGAAWHVGHGRNRWSMVYRDDVAALVRRVVEARAAGTFHAVDGEPIAAAEVARAAGAAAGARGEPRAIPIEEARAEMGGFAEMLALDVGAGARRALGWAPRHPSFRAAAEVAVREWREAGEGS